MKWVLRLLFYVCAGALAFWVPSVAWHALGARVFFGADALMLSVLLPLLSVAAFVMLWRRSPAGHPAFLALPMLLGVWLSGPLFMMISATFTGGGFAQPGGWALIAEAALHFPIYAYMMSAYDGSLLALLLVTMFLSLLSTGALLTLPKRLP